MKNRFIDNIRNGYLLFMKSTELETDDSFLVELNSLGILTVKGSRDILTFNEEEILIECKSCYLDIKGKNLYILKYSKNSTVIGGDTETISRLKRKEDENSAE